MATPAGGATANLICDGLAKPMADDDPFGLTGAPGAEAAPRWMPLILAKPPGLDTVVGVIKPPLQVISALLEVIAALLEVLSAILVGLLDPYRALVLAAYKLLKDLVADIINAGFYLYFYAPGIFTLGAPKPSDHGLPDNPIKQFRHGMQGGQRPVPIRDQYEQWAQLFGESFDDPGDEMRPILSDGASIAAVFVVAAAPSIEGLRQALFLIGSLLNIEPFKLAFKNFKVGPDIDLQRARQEKVAPDWERTRLLDLFPDLKELKILPKKLRELLLTGQGLTGLLTELAKGINDKVASIKKLVEAIEAIIALLDSLKSAGLYALPVFTAQGVGVEARLRQGGEPAARRLCGRGLRLAAGPSIAEATVLFNMLNPANIKGVLEEAVKTNIEQATSAADKAQLNTHWKDFKQTAADAGDAMKKAVEDAPATFKKNLSDLGDDIMAVPGNVGDALKEMGQSAQTNLVDNPVKRAEQLLERARSKGPRSLALGLGASPDRPVPPNVVDAPPKGGSDQGGGGGPA
ncbi:MAG: hypothetical protein U0359_39630 [Byssovorax sp.]